jgi:hypothetical protein
LYESSERESGAPDGWKQGADAYDPGVDTFLAIASKRDTRRYADEVIPEEVVERILNAGRMAGSARNRQP